MKIYSIFDDEFRFYGKVVDGDFTSFIKVLSKKPCPEDSTVYVPSDEELEAEEVSKYMEKNWFGGLPVQVGYCNGHNNMLNCLEYHTSSEINVMEKDTILLLGCMWEIENGKFDTSKTKAFLVPAGKAVEMYATTLHYAPCGVDGDGFRAAVVLPKGTNYEKPADAVCPLLWGSNKWLLAHPDTNEAKAGAYIGLVGENIKL